MDQYKYNILAQAFFGFFINFYILHLANVSKAKPKAKPNLAIKINNVTSQNYALAMLGLVGIVPLAVVPANVVSVA